MQRLNPGPGLADFWSEFKRPNKYRWPILAGSALLTGSLMYLLTDDGADLDWIVIAILVVIAIGAIVAMVAENVRIRLGILALAAVFPALIFWQFSKERWRIPMQPNKVEYITTFEDGRSDAEIAASNAANQVVQDRLRAEQAAREEAAKEMYRDLGRATGLDVDAMEREIAKDEQQQGAGANPAD